VTLRTFRRGGGDIEDIQEGGGGDIEDVLVGVGLLVLLALASHEHPQRQEVRLLVLQCQEDWAMTVSQGSGFARVGLTADP